MTALLASLASAAFYGAADFLGGLASRRSNAIAIVAIAQLSGLVALGLVMPLLPPSTPAHRDWIWGAAAGVTGGVGVALLYRALAMGSMAIVAPITAVCAVSVPVAVSVARGERLGMGTASGILLALAAIALVSRQRAEEQDNNTAGSVRARAAVATAFASGVAIGLFFLALAETDAHAGMWPLVAARGLSSAMFVGLALALIRPLHMPATVAAIAVAGGVLDILANVLYLVATRYGPLSIVVTLSSLYPASTVLLARLVLGERLSRLQTAGIVCALVAVMLIVGTR
ncbi:MAG: DMT family transporter [Vicinamibacterales bacterium]